MKPKESNIGWPPAGQNPYKVPEGYFERLPDRLLHRIQQEEPGLHAKRGIKVRSLYWLTSGVAAALVIAWFGLRSLVILPGQERRFDNELALFLEFSKGDLNEGLLVDYWVNNSEAELEDASSGLMDFWDSNPEWIPELVETEIAN